MCMRKGSVGPVARDPFTLLRTKMSWQLKPVFTSPPSLTATCFVVHGIVTVVMLLHLPYFRISWNRGKLSRIFMCTDVGSSSWTRMSLKNSVLLTEVFTGSLVWRIVGLTFDFRNSPECTNVELVDHRNFQNETCQLKMNNKNTGYCLITRVRQTSQR